MSPPTIQHHDAHSLASGRTRAHEVIDTCGFLAFLASAGYVGVQIARGLEGHGWLVAFATLLGFFGADFLSGFVHWMGDTWGSSTTPVVGKIFIRTFREHHVDQESITRHGFIEVNGSNCLTSTPLLWLAMLLPVGPESPGALFGRTFALSLCVSLFGTNQFHKWAHMKQPPRLVALLQRVHLILPPEHHAIHHAAPYNKYYCITVGWLNGPLHWIGFFPALEKLITATTGALPRRDDIGDAAAFDLAEREGVLPGAPAPLAADDDELPEERRVRLSRR